MPVISECDLPGIGRKFQMELRSGDRLTIVVHDDGRRELYHFYPDDPEESISVVTLDDTEARAAAGIVGGMAYKPKALESMEVALDDLHIEWFKVEPGFTGSGRTIGELRVRHRTGATIIAVITPDHTKRVNPGPDQVIPEGATVVVVGERPQVKACKRLLSQGTG